MNEFDEWFCTLINVAWFLTKISFYFLVAITSLILRTLHIDQNKFYASKCSFLACPVLPKFSLQNG